MKVVYKVSLKEPLEFSETPIDIIIDGVEVSWEINNNNVTGFLLAFPGQKIEHKDNAIRTVYPEFDEQAYKVGTYVSNSILFQTGYDVPNFRSLIGRSVSLIGETKEEQEELAKGPHRVQYTFPTVQQIVNYFEPSSFSQIYDLSPVLAIYAEGERVESPFAKYEQFYKVIEYFFDDTGEILDQKVSSHITQYDISFTQTKVNELRQLRNRCVHPKHKKPLNQGDIASIREVEGKLNSLRKLARLLINHPLN